MDRVDIDVVTKQFRSGTVKVLISTTLFVRDIDVMHAGLVLNYDLPKRKEHYTVRFGRAGRFDIGKKRTAINFVLPKDAEFIQEIHHDCNNFSLELPTDLDAIELS